MSIFKCKMCGGTIEFEPGATVGVCDSCGTKQTLPRLDNDRRANLYDRANHFRRANEFDKAAGLYEQILNEDTTDAEAYWSLVLCRFGIEYVEDPATHQRVPTVNRTQYTSIFDDPDYKSALQYADGYQRSIYEEEAAAINEIQKGVLEISQKEKPFDVFICYKETDANGRRTPDSVLANDLYHQLTQEGFKVFFARITLEDKLGTAYEPYIFAALNSAKVMVVIGTRPEYFNAVWVKNEWSRYLSLVKASGGKKVLIPAYRDMDPYDLPEEFSHLLAQDMSKLGFMQDLIRGVKKIAGATEAKPVQETVVVNAGGANAAPLLRRAFMFLEDGEWAKADDFCEQVLNLDPENAQAYLGKLMAELRVRRQEDLPNCKQPFDGRNNFKKAIRFGDEKLETEMRGYIDHIIERNENARLTGIYNGAVGAMNAANTETAYKAAAETFQTIPGFKDADALAEQCLERAKQAKGKVLAVARALKEGGKTKAAPTLEEKLSAAKTRIGDLVRIQDAFASTQAQIQALHRELNEATSQEKQLSEQRSRLGIFAGKEKKRIDEELAGLSQKKRSLVNQISQFQEGLGGYASLADIERDLNETRNSAADLETQIESARSYAGGEYTCEEALNIYLRESDMATEINNIYPEASLIPAMLGRTDTICFGRYAQEENGSPKPIEWQVLARENRRVLVISKYALDCKQYNTENTSVTWETCTLRKWLNESFYSEAFNHEEKSCIQSTTVTADKNPQYRTSAGNNTTDKVFLLSITAVNKYFSSNKARQCAATDYAKARGAYTNARYSVGGKAACWWWLRSPGISSINAAFVDTDGSVIVNGFLVNYDDHAVRPALWIDLGS